MLQYFKKLIIFSVIVFIVAFFITLLPQAEPLQLFTWYGIAFFTMLSATTFFILKNGIKQQSGNSFLTFVYLATFAKMILCVLAVLGYFFIAKPEKIYFIIPFFILYVCYTVFETYHLVKESQKFKAS